MMTARSSFFAELKRRNVLRAVVLYVGSVWALAQGISQLSGPFGLANWVTRWFVIACSIGFPFWVVFAWFYEFTPQGFKRDNEIRQDAPVRHSNARMLDFAIIGVLAAVVVLLASGYFIHRTSAVSAGIAAPGAAAYNPPANSLVVLPFQNLNDDPKQQYFSDGITEELTDALGRNPALRVIAWDTASKLRHSAESNGDIGKALDVAYLLQGSIEREGGQVRIIAELVDARTGVQLWSQHYDDTFAKIFEVQDRVSEAIAGALKVRFAKADLPQGGTSNPRAHELVLKGRALLEKFDTASLEAAQRDFEQAIALDPDYAEAHALLSRMLLSLTERSDLPLKTTLPKARAEAERALALDRHNADAWVALGSADASADPPDIAKARADYRSALALDPSNASAHIDYGMLLPIKEALAEEQEATLLDPANETAWNDFGVEAQDLGSWAQEIKAFETLIKLDPADVDSAFGLAFAYQKSHQYDKMVEAFDFVKPSTPLDLQQVAAGRLTYRALTDPALHAQALAALKGLTPHLSNQDVSGNLLQLYLALGQAAPALDLLESFCPADPVGCNDLAINPMYAALHGEPRFETLATKYTTATVQ